MWVLIVAIRKIFVDPHDTVEVYVMHDPTLPKNLREWRYTVRPVMFSFVVEQDGITVWDPQLNISLQLSTSSPKYPLIPIDKELL